MNFIILTLGYGISRIITISIIKFKIICQIIAKLKGIITLERRVESGERKWWSRHATTIPVLSRSDTCLQVSA